MVRMHALSGTPRPPLAPNFIDTAQNTPTLVCRIAL